MNRLSLQNVYQLASNGLLHERMWNLGVEKVWRNSGITKTHQKKHMIWGNTHKTFFKNLSQCPLAGKAPVLVPVSGSGTANTESPGRPRGRLAGGGHGRGQGGGDVPWAALALPQTRSVFSLALHWQGLGGKAEQASWEMHLFQNKGTEITLQRNVLSAYSPRFGRNHRRSQGLPAHGSGLRPGPARTMNPVSPRTMWLLLARPGWRLCTAHLDLSTWARCSQG